MMSNQESEGLSNADKIDRVMTFKKIFLLLLKQNQIKFIFEALYFNTKLSIKDIHIKSRKIDSPGSPPPSPLSVRIHHKF